MPGRNASEITRPHECTISCGRQSCVSSFAIEAAPVATDPPRSDASCSPAAGSPRQGHDRGLSAARRGARVRWQQRIRRVNHVARPPFRAGHASPTASIRAARSCRSVHIDVVDTWGKRTLGACAYHVWHPKGCGYEALPPTRFGVAARRAQRFTRAGPSAYTLDLRRFQKDRPMPAAEDQDENP